MEELEIRVTSLERQNTTLYQMVKTEMDLIENLNRRCNILQECMETMQGSLKKDLEATQELIDLIDQVEGD